MSEDLTACRLWRALGQNAQRSKYVLVETQPITIIIAITRAWHFTPWSYLAHFDDMFKIHMLNLITLI